MVNGVTTIVRRQAPKSPKVSTKLIEYWAERMLLALDREEAELSILLTDDPTIARLNREYRHKDRPTDVLSFHFDSTGIPVALEAGWLLGDIVISLDTATRQALSRKRPLEEELRWLLAHGILHLVGYDHANAEEKRIMVTWTKKLVRAAGDAPTPTSTTSPRRAKAAPSSPRRAKAASSSPRRAKAASSSPRRAKAAPSSPRRAKAAPSSPRRAKPAPSSPRRAKTAPSSPRRAKPTSKKHVR